MKEEETALHVSSPSCRVGRIETILLCFVVFAQKIQCLAFHFQPAQSYLKHRTFNHRLRHLFEHAASETVSSNPINAPNSTVLSPSPLRPCFYKDSRGQRRVRWELDTLVVGQELECTIPSNFSLCLGRTGSKVFCECGVGRCRDGQNWKIVFGMLRLDARKESVARKQLQRLKKKEIFTAYVSRIRTHNDQFDIVLKAEEVLPKRPLVSVGQLVPGQNVVGQVDRVKPYGVLLRIQNEEGVEVNRHGLLHIKTVADLFGHYIDKEEGLKQAGLNRGDRIKLQVASVQSKRLLLDFTDEAKAAAQEEKTRRKDRKDREASTPPTKLASQASVVGSGASSQPNTVIDSSPSPSSEDGNSDDEDLEDEEDWDDYDELNDIEDQLGLGTY